MDIKFCQNGWFKYYIDSSNIHHILIELNGEITHVKSKSSLYSIFNSVNQSKTIQENEAYIKVIALRNNKVEEEVEEPKKEVKKEVINIEKPKNKIGTKSNCSKEEIIQDYKNLQKKYPTMKIKRDDYAKIGSYTRALVEKTFGSWTNFMKEVESDLITSQLDFVLE